MSNEKRELSMYLGNEKDATKLTEFVNGLESCTSQKSCLSLTWMARIAAETFSNSIMLKARFDEILNIQKPPFVPWVYITGIIEWQAE